mmetsp:Transcript_68968/g.111903  ORF Transcript_68968/g.111903 Transcript_68968/m.111903 type:complete len:130 (-) Transcript_68968:136-525(-)
MIGREMRCVEIQIARMVIEKNYLEYKCPISQSLMHNAVTIFAVDPKSTEPLARKYDRLSILKHFQHCANNSTKPSDPSTNLALQSTEIIENQEWTMAIQGLAQRYLTRPPLDRERMKMQASSMVAEDVH